MVNEISVLIVDDNLTNILLLQRVMEDEGYRALTATNGPDGREIAAREQPGIILLDIVMPDEDGFETCRKLKENSATTDIPVVFISTLNDTGNIVEGLTVGGIDFISKPFQIEELKARVKNYLKLRHSYLRIIEEQASRLRQIQEAQQAILPKPADLPAAGFGIVYWPILEAGGDFYDVFQISPDVYGYFVGDISGHDLGASFATSALKALMRQNASPLYSPEETIRMMNSVLLSLFTGGQHLTAVYASLNRAKSELLIVNAAHPPVLLLSNQNGVQFIEAEGDILGVFKNAEFSCRKIKVSKGDRLFIYSDGLLETFNNKQRNRTQGGRELLNIVTDLPSMNIQDATEKIAREMFTNDYDMEDDVVLMGIDV